MLRSEDLDLVFKLGLLLEKLISFAGKAFSCLICVPGIEAARKMSITSNYIEQVSCSHFESSQAHLRALMVLGETLVEFQ
jgi:hypothetical protein